MTKEQLRNYRKIKDEHRQVEQRLLALEAHPERDTEALLPLVNLYIEKLAKLAEAQLAIEVALDVLDYTERKLIRLRYFDGLPWHRVAAGIHYSEQHTKRLHGAILLKLKKV